MKKIKTTICALLALLTATCALGACGITFPSPDDSHSNESTADSSSLEDSSSSENSSSEHSPDNSSDDSVSDENSASDSTSDSGSSDSETPDDSTSDSTSDSGSSDNSSSDETLALLQAAYALKSGAYLSGTHTLTGVVTQVEKKSSGDICLTFVVDGYTDYPMYCYWLQDADFVKVGYTITVSGKIKNHNGLIEFERPTLVDYESSSGDGSDSSGNTDWSSYAYTDFTAAEKQLFLTYVGEVIPFLPNDEYYVEGWDYDNPYDYSDGLCFYTYGNTEEDFTAYRALYADYTLTEVYEDDYGDTCYVYENGNVQVDMSRYYYNGEYCVDVYACALSGNTGGSDNTGGGNQGDSGADSDVELLTSDGKGLPTGANGVHNVDFTDAKYAKNVADQYYYLDGCPTTGDVKVLVVPVEFSDRTAAAQGYTLDTLEKAFNGDMGATDYRSVSDFYYQSSYGKLNLTFDVLDSWFQPENKSSYYLQATMDYYGDTVECGDQMIMDEFLRAYDATIDFSDYDSDNNGTIDAIVFVNTLSINSDSIMQWAYRYWNIYADDNDEYDGVYANDYMWASYQFLFEDESGDFNDKNAVNTYTYIHEFGHVLGADDYYDTNYSDSHSPMGGNDIMDSALGDHNPYSKFNYGWITQSKLIVAESSVTLTLNAFAQSDDTVIIANDWDDELGAYQEYFVLAYYTNEGLHTNGGGYFSENGVVVYHVNASLYVETINGATYYNVYNNNTDPDDPDGYGTQNDLIELVQTSDGEYVFGKDDPLPANTYTDNGEKIAYTFTVNNLTAESATITFHKNN